MTQPPYRQPHEQPGYVPYDTGQGGPQTPPGFAAPGQTPWASGQPLAAANTVAKKRFVLVMAFFAVLLVVSVAGFVLTKGDDVRRTADGFTDDITAPFTLRPDDGGAEPSDPPADRPVPKPVVYRGSGSKVLKIRRPERGEALIYLKADPGQSLLSVTGADDKGTATGFVIASFGAYEGVRMLDVTRMARTTQLEIETPGSWVVEIRSVRSARAFGRSMSGRGDSVFRYTGPAGTATIRGGAEMRPFLVMAHQNGFPRLIASGGGQFNGEKLFPQGPILVEVQSGGRWSITVR